VNALFGSVKRFRADYRVLPWTTFTDPEVAHVGHNEASAREEGVEYEWSATRSATSTAL
jgi:pyruvate/2-oxoglutarate dehydrogenase complex dihydrolipoamide dehydrogenase (E3) component